MERQSGEIWELEVLSEEDWPASAKERPFEWMSDMEQRIEALQDHVAFLTAVIGLAYLPGELDLSSVTGSSTESAWQDVDELRAQVALDGKRA